MQSRRVVAPKRCLVLLPIGVTLRKDGPTFLAIYTHILLPALRATGVPMDIFRGDEVLRAGLTLHDRPTLAPGPTSGTCGNNDGALWRAA